MAMQMTNVSVRYALNDISRLLIGVANKGTLVVTLLVLIHCLLAQHELCGQFMAR